MAVTLTQAQLSAAIRLGNTTEENAEAARLLTYSTTAVTKHAPNAPDEVHNEAVIRLSGYLFDMPNAGRGMAYANALRNSGAGAILLPYRKHRAGAVAGATPDDMQGTTGNPVTNVTVSGSTLTVHYADGSTADRTLPTGGGTVDQTARDAAAAAMAAIPGSASTTTEGTTEYATQAEIDAEANPSEGRRVLDVPGVFRAIARKVKNATTTARGIVLLARNEDVASSETDLTRVPDVNRAILLIRRLIGEDVRSIPEAEASHVGRPLVATRASRPWVGYERLGTDGYDDNSITEAKLDSAARAKLNATGGTADAQARAAAATNAGNLQTEIAAREAGDVALGARIDGKQDSLTHAQRIDLLQFEIVPQTIIGYTENDVTLDWRVWVSGGETLPDTWMSLHLDGLATLAAPVPTTPGADLHRHKLSATVIYQFTLATANRRNLVTGRTGRRQGRSIGAEIRFHDAITGGNIVDRRVIGIDWLPTPAATVTLPRWYLLGHASIPRANTAGRAINLTVLTREGQRDYAIDSKYADYEAVKAALDAGQITQVAVRVIETDGDGADSDEQTYIFPITAFFSTSAIIDVHPDFALGENPKKIRLSFGASGVTVTPDFSYAATGRNAVISVRLGVWA